MMGLPCPTKCDLLELWPLLSAFLFFWSGKDALCHGFYVFRGFVLFFSRLGTVKAVHKNMT
jgi:hypothetical protein